MNKKIFIMILGVVLCIIICMFFVSENVKVKKEEMILEYNDYFESEDENIFELTNVQMESGEDNILITNEQVKKDIETFCLRKIKKEVCYIILLLLKENQKKKTIQNMQ